MVLDADLVVRKLRLADQESMPDEPMDDPLAKHDADFVMLSACISQLLEGLHKLGRLPGLRVTYALVSQ